jgi:hypothetical protein
MRRHGWTSSALLAALALGSLGVATCADDKSYAVVNVKMKDGELEGVKQFVVYVVNGVRTDLLYYPQSPGGPWRISTTEKVDFSISFKSSYVGFLKVGVEPRDGVGNVLGYGEAEKMIDPGHRFDLDVAVVLGARAPVLGSDGGVRGGDTMDGIPISMCVPTMPGTCGAGKTCGIDCAGTAPVGVCLTAGAGKDGDSCITNRDCEPGTQCFTYGCARICRKFCTGDADCPAGLCNRSVSCGTTQTQHKFCSQSCDPTGDGVGACRNGLKCLLFANEAASCDCPEATRTKTDGQPCETTASCAPGFLCVAMGSPTLVCRPICKLADKICPAGKTCTELVEPKYQVYGACL